MKKRALSMSLAICLAVSLLCIPAAAQSTAAATQEQTVRALGIINGDTAGNMNLAANVTRAQFVKMLVAASASKDDADENTNVLLFRDVPVGYWASGYMKAAVDHGWLTGYADGTFRPYNPVTLQAAAAALLRLLGYASDDVSSLFPTVMMKKFTALGLGDGITKDRTDCLTRGDCVTIFYNLMNAATSGGSVYAQTLGYALNSAGKIDYTSLVSANLKGPFVLQTGESLASLLPLSSGNLSVYKDGSESSLTSANTYDVYYYNENLRSVWLYDTKATGTYTAASPSDVSPTAVTVAGNSYTIGTSSAAYQMSSLGTFALGDTVTLLLGMDGTVVDVIPAGQTDTTYYGVVTSSQVSSYTDSAGKAVSVKTASVACTDGIVRQYPGTASVGALVSVSVSGGDARIASLNSKAVSGLVNAAGTKLGTLSFADSAEILDTNSNGDYLKLYPLRLAGVTLSGSDVRYYTLDGNGDIDRLILNDTTGDLYSYGVITKVTEITAETSISSYYEYLINGVTGAQSPVNTVYNVTVGGAIFRYKDGAVSSMKNLKTTSITSVNSLYAMSGTQKYPLSQTVQVYKKVDGTYQQINLSAVSDSDQYSLLACQDDFGYRAGGLVRVIIATPKS